MSLANLDKMFRRADPHDLEEGLVAYPRYHLVMQKLANRFRIPLPRVIAAFVSLSPNSSYNQNLRSTVSVLDGVVKKKEPESIVVSTYGHCKNRAIAYAAGNLDFLKCTKGPKITSFYHNILDPNDTRWVTVDGHMSCIWQGKDMTMREALISERMYKEIRDGIRELSFRNYMKPCQMEAILWFTRKRVSNVVYDPQLELFADQGDVWKTFVDVDNMKPYGRKDAISEKHASREDDARLAAWPEARAPVSREGG